MGIGTEKFTPPHVLVPPSSKGSVSKLGPILRSGQVLDLATKMFVSAKFFSERARSRVALESVSCFIDAGNSGHSSFMGGRFRKIVWPEIRVATSSETRRWACSWVNDIFLSA